MSAPEPVALEAERKVLGTLLVFYSPATAENVRGTGLKPRDFYYRRHEVVYRAIQALDQGSEWVEPLTVSRFLASRVRDSGGTWLDEAGGEAQVEFLACFADANALIPAARIVAEDARWRRWLRALYAAREAVDAKDDDAFWSAIGSVREDVLPGELRVIEGDGEVAA